MNSLKTYPFPCALVLIALFFLGGCGETKYLLKYEVTPDSAQEWPHPPEKPRFRYVGELTGQQNIVEVKGSRSLGTKIGDFLKWVVGLKSEGEKPIVLQRPQCGVVDKNGRILVTDVSRQAIFVFDPNNGSLTVWDRAMADLGFKTPVGIALGKDNTILVADADLGRVLQLDDKGNPIRDFGSDILTRPTGLARDPISGHIFVADTKEHDIKIFDDDGELLDIIGKRGVKLGEFNGPTHLSFVKNKLYVTDTLNARVQVLTRSGDFLSEFGRRGIFMGDMVRPKGVAADSDGNIYVIESLNDYLLVYNSEGQFLMPLGGTGSGVGQFYLPSGVWTDSKDHVYIADMFNGRVVILQYLGNH
jgi:DNA-binding beta-propeller fold protein YncE